MRQALAVARALIAKPSILLLDEPTASLDAASEQAMVRSLDEATRGITTVFVTHRGAMLQMADRVLLVEGGRVVMDGPRDEVLQKLQQQAQAQTPAQGSAQPAGPAGPAGPPKPSEA
jgi:ATP-binding cassette subfamily C protein LapB